MGVKKRVFTELQKSTRRAGFQGETADEVAALLYREMTPQEISIFEKELEDKEKDKPRIQIHKRQYRGK